MMIGIKSQELLKSWKILLRWIFEIHFNNYLTYIRGKSIVESDDGYLRFSCTLTSTVMVLTEYLCKPTSQN